MVETVRPGLVLLTVWKYIVYAERIISGAFALLLPLNFKYILHLRVLKTARRIEDVLYFTRI